MRNRVTSIGGLGLCIKVSILKEAARINACPRSRRGFQDLCCFARKKLDVTVDDKLLHELFRCSVFVREASLIDPVHKKNIRAIGECFHERGLFNGSPISEDVLAQLFDCTFSSCGLAVAFPVLECIVRHKDAPPFDQRPRMVRLASQIC